MSRERTLAWLAALQAELTAVVRTPLEARGGSLRANPAAYSRRACEAVAASAQRTAAERLAVYNRQYWLRLLRATQQALPLSCRLLGAWHFNAIATGFLLAHPPRVHDLGAVADGFDQYLAHALRGDPIIGSVRPVLSVPRAALLEAAQIDLAFRRSFAAAPQSAFQPAGTLTPDSRLSLSQTLTLIRQRWPLVQLRERTRDADVEQPLALPERLSAPETWAVFRAQNGTGQLLLDPQHARLLELLRLETLSGALERLEADCPAAQRDGLPSQVQTWLATSTRFGFFTASPAREALDDG